MCGPPALFARSALHGTLSCDIVQGQRHYCLHHIYGPLESERGCYMYYGVRLPPAVHWVEEMPLASGRMRVSFGLGPGRAEVAEWDPSDPDEIYAQLIAAVTAIRLTT